MAANSAFKTKLVGVAKQQHTLLGGLHTGDLQLRDQIARYWQEVGFSVPEDIDTSHWSAVFISWCMRNAGASNTEFPPAQAHWEYAQRALQSSGLFAARRLTDYAPQNGDLLHFNRDGGTTRFEQIQNGHYPADGAIFVELGSDNEARFVLGNDPNGSVGLQTAAIDSNGFILQRESNPFICIIEVLK
jgi:hypothetical protein